MSRTWWFWLLATGTSLALVTCVKYVGLFTVALVGVLTLRALWQLWCDLSVPIVPAFVANVGSRALGLIFVPLIIYTAIFAFHFHLLPLSGTGAF